MGEGRGLLFHSEDPARGRIGDVAEAATENPQIKRMKLMAQASETPL